MQRRRHPLTPYSIRVVYRSSTTRSLSLLPIMPSENFHSLRCSILLTNACDPLSRRHFPVFFIPSLYISLAMRSPQDHDEKTRSLIPVKRGKRAGPLFVALACLRNKLLDEVPVESPLQRRMQKLAQVTN